MRAVLILCLTLVASLPAAAQGFGAMARVLAGDSALGDRGQGAEMTLALTQAVPFRVFSLTGPYRVVVDLRQVSWSGLPADFDGAEAVTGVDTGAAYQPGWSRMVLTLDAPLLPAVAAMQTDPVTGAAEITLRLEPATPEAFAAAAGAPPGTEAGLAARQAAPLVDEISRTDGRLVVVLDPGHGGVDPGAVRGAHHEADLVLTFARELREALRRTGQVEVVMTRDADIFVPLPTRITLARAAGADLFISIHADAVAEGRAQGATVYTLSETASDAASAALAEQHDRADLLEGVDLSGTDDVVADILMDLARVETAPRAAALADTLVAGIDRAGVALHSHPRGAAGFTVLKAADIPSVLLEIGFMSADGDLENLLNPGWRARMQGALVAAILDWAEADAARSALLRQ
nr:N-acetylmuramoyl-L-alanine amidase [Roseibacterium elongatum]